jgi:flagellin-specific chaperone FliS
MIKHTGVIEMPRAYFGASEYKRQDVMSANPVHLVVLAYDLAIRSCDTLDFETAIKAITALRDALDFDYPEAAGGLLALYNWCLDCVRAKDYDNARKVLVELRDAWTTVEKRLNKVPSAQGTQVGMSPIA